MPKRSKIEKVITVAKHKFRLEIYLSLEGYNDVCWEIYAFSNKDNLNKFIETNYIFEK